MASNPGRVPIRAPAPESREPPARGRGAAWTTPRSDHRRSRARRLSGDHRPRPGGPRAGGRPVLHARRRRALGGRGGAARSCRGPSRSPRHRTAGAQLYFLLEEVGPGTGGFPARPRRRAAVNGPLGQRLHRARGRPARILVGGGIGVAPLALLQAAFDGRGRHPRAAWLPRRGHARRARAVPLRRARQRGRPRRASRLVTDLLARSSRGRRGRRRLLVRPAGMLEAVRSAVPSAGRACRARDGVADGLRFGACLAAPCPPGRRLPARLRRRPGDRRGAARERRGARRGARVSVEFCGLRLAHPIINGSGTFDAIAARRASATRCSRRSPSPPTSRRRSRCAPRAGNPPPRLWETPAGMINSIGLPNKGLDGYLAEDLPIAGFAHPAAGAESLPVPLITNVMGSTAESSPSWSRRVRRAGEIAAIELECLLPERRTGPRHRRRPGRAGGAARGRAPADREAADRQADAERRRLPAVALAAERGGADAVSLINTLRATAIAPGAPRDRPGSAAAPAGCRARRSVRSRSPRSPRSRRAWRFRWSDGGRSERRRTPRVARRRASLVAVGTESFRDPRRGDEIAAGDCVLRGLRKTLQTRRLVISNLDPSGPQLEV